MACCCIDRFPYAGITRIRFGGYFSGRGQTRDHPERLPQGTRSRHRQQARTAGPAAHASWSQTFDLPRTAIPCVGMCGRRAPVAGARQRDPARRSGARPAGPCQRGWLRTQVLNGAIDRAGKRPRDGGRSADQVQALAAGCGKAQTSQCVVRRAYLKAEYSRWIGREPGVIPGLSRNCEAHFDGPSQEPQSS